MINYHPFESSEFQNFCIHFFCGKERFFKRKKHCGSFWFQHASCATLNLQLPKACNFRTQRRGACVDFNQRPSGKPSGRFHFISIRLQDVWGVISFTCSNYFRSDRIIHQKIPLPHHATPMFRNNLQQINWVNFDTLLDIKYLSHVSHVILLMEEILHHLGCIAARRKSWDIYHYQLVQDFFHQQ